MSGRVKLGPSKTSWKISLRTCETGHKAPLWLGFAPIWQDRVYSSQAGALLSTSPVCTRQFAVANEVPVRKEGKVAGLSGRFAVEGVEPLGIVSFPAACAWERS